LGAAFSLSADLSPSSSDEVVYDSFSESSSGIETPSDVRYLAKRSLIGRIFDLKHSTEKMGCHTWY
jgi:hypothetical protein